MIGNLLADSEFHQRIVVILDLHERDQFVHAHIQVHVENACLGTLEAAIPRPFVSQLVESCQVQPAIIVTKSDLFSVVEDIIRSRARATYSLRGFFAATGGCVCSIFDANSAELASRSRLLADIAEQNICTID